MPRDRPDDALRPIEIVTGFLPRNPSSVLYSSGETRVLSTATLQAGVPPFLEGQGRGWATAEYDLLPGSTSPRHPRDRGGRLSGRTVEIQRLIGRSLRGVLDFRALDGFTLVVDCDILQADGGTRTAAVNAAYVSISLLVAEALSGGSLRRTPLREAVGAVSVGLSGGRCLLDLDYAEDSTADVDLNLVLAESGSILEIQGTSEGRPFRFEELDRMLALARRGIEEILAKARAALGT